MLSAFRILNATKNSKMSCDLAAFCARLNARLRRLFGSSRHMDESLPTFVEDSEVGVDDIDIATGSERNVHFWSVRQGPKQDTEGEYLTILPFPTCRKKRPRRAATMGQYWARQGLLLR